MTSQITRSPLQNNLITEPGQVGVLNESSQFSVNKPFNNQEIGFSFDWMLSVPFVTGICTSLKDLDKPTVISTDEVPAANLLIDNYMVPWARIPIAWAEYTRPQVDLTVVCVKAWTPLKLMLSMYNPALFDNSTPFDADVYGKRNFTTEFDVTMQRIHTFKTPLIMERAMKKSSTYISKQKLYGVHGCALGAYQLVQLTPPQRGSLFPDSFNIFIWQCYAGTQISTITSPSLCYVSQRKAGDSLTFDIVNRRLIGDTFPR